MNLDGTAMRKLVAAARDARLATVGPGDQPHLVPVVFALDDPEFHGRGLAEAGPRASRDAKLWIAVDHKPKRSRDLARLRNIAAQPKVSVLVDHYDEDWTQLWWVRLDGEAHILPKDRWRHPIEALQAKYPQYRVSPPEGPVIEIRIRDWRGWTASESA